MSKKTVTQIKESGNEYCIAVKGNQPNLYEQIKKNINKSLPIDEDFQTEFNRGRWENRRIAVYDNLEGISSKWVGLKRIVLAHRFGYRPDNGLYNEIHYYILSKSTNDARWIAEGIRSHWAIENKLHYVKDVVQNEDNCKIHSGIAVETLSILKNIAINVFRANGFKSITKANILFANKIDELIKLIQKTIY